MHSGRPTKRPILRETENLHFDSRTAIIGLLVFTAYFLGVKAGFALTFHPHPIAVLWPANGIVLAFLLLTPKRHWWFLLLIIVPAHLLSHLPRHLPAWQLVWQIGFNILLCVFLAGTLQRFGEPPPKFDRLREVIVYLLTVGAITALFSGLTPTCLFSLLSPIPGPPAARWISAWTEWRRVFLSNFLAFLLLTPTIILTLSTRIFPSDRRRVWRIAEFTFLNFGLLILFVFFARGHINPATRPALLYAPLPLLLWAAVRFGSRGASTSLLALALTSIWMAVHGHEPLIPGATPESALALQLFLVVISIPLIFLAAVIEERGRAEEQFAKAFRSGPDAMLIKQRRDARIIDVNDEWQRIFGFRRDAAVGRTLSELNIYLTEDDRSRLIDGTAEGEILHDLEISLRTKAGEVRQSLLSADIVEVAGEECLVIAIRDITARKKAEEALRESEELNRVIIESLLSLVVIVDKDGEIIATNHAWRGQHAALSAPQIPAIGVGDNYLEPCRKALAAGDTAVAEIVSGIEAVLSGHLPQFKCEYLCVKPGAPLWFEMSVLPLQRKAGGAVISHNNITDRKNAEEASRSLVHASRLAVVGELTGSIAHEINQPLGAILSNADAAEMLLELDSPPLDEVRKILSDIRSEDLRASEVIRHIRALLRKNEMQMETLEVNEVAFDVMRLVSSDARRRHMPLQTEFTAAPTTIRGDRVHLQQVLLNLVLNAMEAMAETPEAARRLIVRTERAADQRVEVSVTDTGRGIRPEKLCRLFESFFTTKENGMGLGLAIARSVIDAHRGRITAENNVDGGATFRCSLPVHRNGSAEERCPVERN